LNLAKNIDMAKCFFKRAGKMGHAESWYRLSDVFTYESFERMYFALKYYALKNLTEVSFHSLFYNLESPPPACLTDCRLLFLAGKVLHRLNFCSNVSMFSRQTLKIQKAENFVTIYRTNIVCSKEAVFTWLLCCRQLCLMTFDANIRLKIARLVWKERKAGHYV